MLRDIRPDRGRIVAIDEMQPFMLRSWSFDWPLPHEDVIRRKLIGRGGSFRRSRVSWKARAEAALKGAVRRGENS